MLRQDVIDAVARGRFHIYPMETIDQGIEIVTGVPAGERDLSGYFPDGSINRRVEARLFELASDELSDCRKIREMIRGCLTTVSRVECRSTM